jgi:hypothetical protein
MESLAIKRVEFISDMLYITVRGQWCNIIVLNVHAPTEDKSDNTKDTFYKEQSMYLVNSSSTT